MIDTGYLNGFEEKLQNELVKLCTNSGMLEGSILSTDDIDNRWKDLAPEYMADAVPQVKDYPTVSVAWAAYLGAAIAHQWDSNWETVSTAPYQSYYGKQGFDDMDDYITNALLGMEAGSNDAKNLENTIRRCGETAVSSIRHEHIDPQTPMAFHIFARTCKVMYRIGAAIELKRLGYRFERVYLS